MLRTIASIAALRGACPVAAVLSVVDAVTGDPTPAPPADPSPVASALDAAFVAGQAHVDAPRERRFGPSTWQWLHRTQ